MLLLGYGVEQVHRLHNVIGLLTGLYTLPREMMSFSYSFCKGYTYLLTKKRVEHGRDSWLLFIDLVKVFDRVLGSYFGQFYLVKEFL